MPFWLRVVLVYMLVAAGLTYIAGISWRLGWELLVIAAGLIPAIVRHSPRLWLLTKRVQYWLLNTNTSWHVNLVLEGTGSEERLQDFVQSLVAGDSNSRILENTGRRILIHYQRLFVFELAVVPPQQPTTGQANANSTSGALSVTLVDQHIGYRHSKNVLEAMLVPFVERLKDAFAPNTGRYGMRISFDGRNPFLGPYVRELKAAEVREFTLEIARPGAPAEEYLRITLPELVVNAGTLEGFRRTALTGLTFGAMGN